MKCENCGYENKDDAKFCVKCGNSLNVPEPSNNSKYIIISLIAVIIVLCGLFGYFALNNHSNSIQTNDNLQNADSQEVQSVDDSESSKNATLIEEDSKDWVSIGKYSGSGSGSESISVPEGRIMVKLSAYPIKNYATNHLYVDGSNGVSGEVEWGSNSAVETKSDSFTYTSSSEELFTIDYYETVSWEVEFFRYQ